MLEILFLWWFCTKLANMAKEKNRPGSWGAVGAILWIGGEIGGLMLAVSGGATGMMNIYPYAIVGALLGAAAAYIIVASLKPVPRDGDLPQARIV